MSVNGIDGYFNFDNTNVCFGEQMKITNSYQSHIFNEYNTVSVTNTDS